MVSTDPITAVLGSLMTTLGRSRLCLSMLCLVLGGGCANPALEQRALSLGLQSSTVEGAGFRHRVFRTDSAMGSDSTMILLIHGDGRAFLSRRLVATDPTPTQSWLLDLAPALSPLGPVIYLGRPCYYGMNTDDGCTPRLWTLDRYGDAVVESLASAAQSLLSPGQKVVIVGYSGGGVLAMLVGRRLGGQTLGVLTFAAPLDVTAWAELHGYSPLTGSTDPANDPASYQHLCQRHLFGRRDREVPPALVASWRWPADGVVDGLATDHSCCWEDIAREAIAAHLKYCSEGTGHRADYRTLGQE